MNVYVFWILFLCFWAIVPLMIIKGRTEETVKVKTMPAMKVKKKGWFTKQIFLIFKLCLSTKKNQIIYK